MEDPEPEADSKGVVSGGVATEDREDTEDVDQNESIPEYEVEGNDRAEDDLALATQPEGDSLEEMASSTGENPSDQGTKEEIAEQYSLEVDDKTEDEIEQECIREGQLTGVCEEQFDGEVDEVLEEAEADAFFTSAAVSESTGMEEQSVTAEPEEQQSLPEEQHQMPENERREDEVNEVSVRGMECSADLSESSSQAQNGLEDGNSPTEGEILEDEIGCVQVSQSPTNVRCKLTHTESVESYEPECDQDEASTDTTQETVASSSLDTAAESTCTSVSPDPCNEADQSCQVLNGISESSQNSETLSESSASVTKIGKDNTCLEVCSNIDDGNSVKSSPTKMGAIHVCEVKSIENDSDRKENSSTALSSVSLKGDKSIEDDLLSELESELGPSESESSRTSGQSEQPGQSISDESAESDTMESDSSNSKLLNGMVESDSLVMKKISELQSQLQQKEDEIKRMRKERQQEKVHFEKVVQERDFYLQQNNKLKSVNVDDLYLPQIKELEYTISQQQNEIRITKEKLQSHDSAAKRAVAALQNELKVRVDQVTKMYEEANKDKDSMVVKYAQAEKNYLSMQKNVERLEAKLREGGKEKEGLVNRVKETIAEKKKMAAELEEKISEIQKLTKETDKQREMISSTDVRVKWAQNKLRAELEAHKETKTELEKIKMKLTEAKEETEQIRRDCQAIIKTYQESEEIKSNALDSQLKVKESELLQEQQAKTNQEELHLATVKELTQLKAKYKELVTEVETLRDKSQCLETERIQTEQTLNKFKEMLQKQKKENKDLQSKVEELVQVRTDFKRAQSTIKSLDAEISELKIANKDLMIDMEACKKRESEKLELTKKLSAKNAELLSENSNLRNQSMSLNGELQALKMEHQSLETEHAVKCDSLEKELAHKTEEVSNLSKKLEEKTKAVEQLTVKLEDGKDEVRTLKRKHGNNIKDLTRQLQQVKRKLENYEVNGETHKDSTSMGSRTSSNGSLNTLGMSENTGSMHEHVNHNSHIRQHSPPEQIQEYPVITEQVEPDRQLLIERIVKLQRSLARKNEKIEFVEDHIQQLVDEIQKKNKIIQSYAMREEAGMLTREEADFNKLQLAKKHSIMGSLYSSHPTDSAMTLDLSLEINRKLQAVLEDTLLKNITLKESLDTLGGEISRLSQENRELQLKLQDKKPKR